MRDYTIRQILKETELLKHINDPDSKVVEELKLPVAGARIDMAVINGALNGFEIKSAVDTLQRLPSQLEAYSKVFDFLYIVTEDKYYKKLLSILPRWVGVIVCKEQNGNVSIKTVRSSKQNKMQDGFYLAKLLWKDELLSILEEYNITHKKSLRTWLLCELLAENLKVKNLSAIVRKKLKARPTDWKILQQTIE